MRRRAWTRGRGAQQGVILFIALIVLVAMSLTGIALMRSVDTNVLIAGNLAFRQGATLAGDGGIEAARAWLAANIAYLNDDQPGGDSRYWANWQQDKDLVRANAANPFDWSTAADLGFDAAGNRVQYVIHRLCNTAGNPNDPAIICVKSTATSGFTSSSGGTKTAPDAGGGVLPGVSSIYYRVTVKITGPRNTVSYVQAVLN